MTILKFFAFWGTLCLIYRCDLCRGTAFHLYVQARVYVRSVMCYESRYLICPLLAVTNASNHLDE
jgi:hypothetical protein